MAAAAAGDPPVDFTTVEYDFDDVSQDLEAFAEDETVMQALQRGVDLRRYAAQVQEELTHVEQDCVDQYVVNSGRVHELHKQMQDCDEVLGRMQEMLQGFQTDLGGISEEIKHLQDMSLSMNVRLRNRRAAENKLSAFLTHAAVMPEMVRVIATSEVNDAFLEQVMALDKCTAYMQQTRPAVDGSSLDMAPADTRAGSGLLPELRQLRLRAVSKIREYFTHNFHALRKPKTNVQFVQQGSLLKYRYLMKFVRESNQEVAEDLLTLYVESMGRTLLSLFKSYLQQLARLELQVATRTDLIAADEASLRGVFSGRVNLSKRVDAFSLADRESVLDQTESEPILVHVALSEGARYPYEAILRSVLRHLCDAACSEYLFVHDFFGDAARAPDTFRRIFARTLSLVMEGLENQLLNCYDTVGLLLMIKVAQAQRGVMARRRMDVLDPTFHRINMLLWPRFKAVFDANLDSVRSATARRLGGNIDLSPHYVTRRYAEFVASVLTLHGGLEGVGGGEDMLMHDLATLRTETVALLERLGATLPSEKDKTVFLINNLDQMLTVLHERRVISDEVSRFEELRTRQAEAFVELELRTCFGRLVSFVQQTEQAFADAKPGEGGVSLDEALVENLARDFGSTWRQAIQQINDDVLQAFANFRAGTEVLKQALAQTLLYWQRFLEIIRRAWRTPPPFARELVDVKTLLHEIKRYNRQF